MLDETKAHDVYSVDAHTPIRYNIITYQCMWNVLRSGSQFLTNHEKLTLYIYNHIVLCNVWYVIQLYTFEA